MPTWVVVESVLLVVLNVKLVVVVRLLVEVRLIVPTEPR